MSKSTLTRSGGFELPPPPVRIEVVGFHGRELPLRKPGLHLWVVLMFQVEPTADRINLDRENLLTIEGPGCFWCEQPWSPELAAHPCTGGSR